MSPIGRNYMSLQERLLKFKQDTNMYTLNPLLDTIDLDIVDKIEDESLRNVFLKETVRSIDKLLDDLTIDYSEKWGQVFSLYNEAYLFIYLSAFVIISKKTEEYSKTPDFQIKYRQKNYYAELKSLAFAKASINYRKVFDEGLSKRVEADEAVRSGQKVVVTEQSIDSYHLSTSKFHVYPKKQVIQILIDKIVNNYKKGQYEVGETILIVDLRQLGITTTAVNAIMPFFYDPKDKLIVSGELWNVAFGKVDNLVLSYPTTYIYGSVEGNLEKQGILHEFGNIRAIAFQTNSVPNGVELVGLYRTKDYEIKNLLDKFCRYSNDDTNTRGYLLSHFSAGK